MPTQPHPPPESSYNPDFFSQLFEIEDRHFWFRARNTIIATLVKSMVPSFPRNYHMLEVGCGTGNALRYLESAASGGTVLGMDLFEDGLRFARRRVSCPLVQADILQPPFERQFQLIGLFDVLEHLPDDDKILSDIYRLLAPEGRLLITVPAHQMLWSYFDEASHHFRRYSKSDLSARLEAAGFDIHYLTEYMLAIFPLVWVGRRLAALKARFYPRDGSASDQMASQELGIVPLINPLLSFLLSQERHLVVRRCPLPFGTSLLAVAVKPT